nr:hypothetical protein [Tanacetum cinerariifolium]
MYDMVGQFIQKKEEEKQTKEEQAANARYWKILACYDDDDDNYTFAITPNEPDNSLSMRDEHLHTIPATEPNEFIKFSVESLIPNLSEFEGEPECDVPACEVFTTLSNIHYDADYDFYCVDNQSFSDEIDSLFDEFVSELTLLKSIMQGIDETDCDPEEETHFIKRLLNLSFTLDYPMPPGIKEDDYDSKRDILILEELLNNDSLLFIENELFHFDIPSSFRPPAKPPNGNTGILNVKVMGDISKQK